MVGFVPPMCVSPAKACPEIGWLRTLAWMLQVLSAQTTLPVPLHAGGRVLQSIDEGTGLNATAGWNLSDWHPQPLPTPGALAPIPLKSVKASSTKAVALQHLKVCCSCTVCCAAPTNPSHGSLRRLASNHLIGSYPRMP